MDDECMVGRSEFGIVVQGIADDICDMLESKNIDYGDENLSKFGQFGIIVRCSDKLSRLEHIINSKTNAVGETAEQEWIDIAGYAMQAIRLIKANRI